ncbi:MAG: 30S ribosomal protein S8 [Candidatus Pacebacteria bacterium]|nr:30S ribosomal protein S8 [Candidatus Paceibacterota bacterium]
MHYNILSELKNAVRAKKDKITFPYSKMDFAILKKLAENGYVKAVEKETVGKKNIIAVRVMHGGKVPVVNDFSIKSKPSRHTYIDYRSLNTVRSGHGISMLSTSQGIMTGKEARKNKVGGEYLFELW